MEFLAALFVGKPQNILGVASVLFGGYLVLRIAKFDIVRRPRCLLTLSLAWGLYAAWEWLVQVRTPEANIRVDLLLIWPILLILSAWSLFRMFR